MGKIKVISLDMQSSGAHQDYEDFVPYIQEGFVYAYEHPDENGEEIIISSVPLNKTELDELMELDTLYENLTFRFSTGKSIQLEGIM